MHLPMSIESPSLESDKSTSSFMALISSLEKLNNGLIDTMSLNFGPVSSTLEWAISLPEKSASLKLL